MMKKALAAIALSGMAMSAHASLVITENFDAVYNLPAKGWSGISTGIDKPNGWYQGDQQLLTAQEGAANSYAAIGYNIDTGNQKVFNEWLYSPVFDATGGATVTFWLQGLSDPVYYDRVRYGFLLNGARVEMTAVNSVPQGEWVQYTATLGADTVGMARFAIQYASTAADANYIGLDSLTITSVPEPASLALLAFGALGLGVARRRRA